MHTSIFFQHLKAIQTTAVLLCESAKSVRFAAVIYHFCG